jgi:transposase InsO family protein
VGQVSRKLSPFGRLLIAQRVVEQGWSVKAAADAAGISRTTAYRWVDRYLEGGVDTMRDRSSAPKGRPRTLPRRKVEAILRARRRTKRGPHFFAGELGLAPSTVYGVLRREGCSRLRDLDRPTGIPIRRRVITADHPGERMHVDVKKLARIPAGGGHRMLGRQAARSNTERARKRGRAGTDYLHSMVDAYSRVAYTEALPDEKGTTCADFLVRAGTFFASHGVQIDEVMTDEAKNYTVSRDFAAALDELLARHKTTGPYRPRINGKVERYNRTITEEWAYRRLYTTNGGRLRALPYWLDYYNHRRPHTALGGLTPMQSLANYVSGKHT